MDYDNDGYLDLFVTRYMEWDGAHNKIAGSFDTYCPPVEYPATTNISITTTVTERLRM